MSYRGIGGEPSSLGELAHRRLVASSSICEHAATMGSDLYRWGEPSSALFVVRQMNYRLRSHVLDRWSPRLLPLSVSRDPEKIGSSSLMTHGRWAYVGSFEDTTAIAASLDDRHVA